MGRNTITVQQTYWDDVYRRLDLAVAHMDQPHWIQTILAEAQTSLMGRVLELGCGQGFDTHYLVRAGCEVVGLDLSRVGLQRVATTLPMVQLVQAALPDPLPLRSAVFDAVVAGLSLHYFRWQDTLTIMKEIRRVLGLGKVLVFRVNAIDDVAHGYGQGKVIEPHLFAQQGRYKRFFTESDCYHLFDDGWQLQVLQPLAELRYGAGKLKSTWAGIARTL